MSPHFWNPSPFPFSRGNKREEQYVRKIIFMKSNVEPFPYYRRLSFCPTKNLKYLKKLNAFVGLFPKSYTNEYLYHPDIYQIEEDIEVKIHIPVMGKILPKPQVIPWGIKRVGADKVWSNAQGKGVRVAVIDTGISFDHPDLEKNIRGGVNILSPILPPYDHNGHGTHIAGTIGAVNNTIGVVGVAPQVSLHAVKAFNKDGTAKLSDIIKGIDWCIDHNMDIINMSFGFNEPSPTFREAIKRAQEAGIIMVAASGNKGTRGRLEYPAQFGETIAVSSINEENKISKFSTIGGAVDLAAPGEKIISTWMNNSYRELSGTSMAVAHVTGVSALMLSKFPNLSTRDLITFMKQTAIPLEDASFYSQGFGVVNASVLRNSYR